MSSGETCILLLWLGLAKKNEVAWCKQIISMGGGQSAERIIVIIQAKWNT